MLNDTRSKEMLLRKLVDISQSEIVSELLEGIEAKKGLISCQLNLHNLKLALSSMEVLEMFLNTDLLFADGIGIKIYRKFSSDSKIHHSNTGIDCMISVLNESNTRKLKIFFLGSNDKTLDKVEKLMNKRWPAIEAAYHHGYFEIREWIRVAKCIREFRPHIVLVGMPTPMKEDWMLRTREFLGCVQLGVGGSFEILAGNYARAPIFIQKIGLEWVFRLLQEPRRLFWRYLAANSWLIKEIVIYKIRQIWLKNVKGSTIAGHRPVEK